MKNGNYKLTLGFTLIETVIYIAIISVFLVSVIQFSTNVIRTGEKARVMNEVQQNARFALERITREIRSADSVNIGASTFDSHPGVLSISKGGANTVFDLSGGVLRITEGAGSPVNLTTGSVNITNLVFENFSVINRTQNIRISITVEHSASDSLEYVTSKTFNTSVVIRTQE